MNTNSDLVGVEIGWNVVRAVVLRGANHSITQYADRVNLGEYKLAEAKFLDPAQAIAGLWEQLNLAESTRVAVGFAPAVSGIVQLDLGDDATSALAHLETAFGVELAKVENQNVISYACVDHIARVMEAFINIGVEIERLELSQISVKRLLMQDFTGKFTLPSGAGWTCFVDNGSIVETIATPEVVKDRGVRLYSDDGSETPFVSLAGSIMSEEFVRKYQISHDSIVVATGVAMGLVRDDQGWNFLDDKQSDLRTKLNAYVAKAEQDDQNQLPDLTSASESSADGESSAGGESDDRRKDVSVFMFIAAVVFGIGVFAALLVYKLFF